MAANAGAPPALILDRIREDLSIFEILLLVLSRRLTIIDDLEFKGHQSTSGSQFLTLSHSCFIADLLNRGFAFRVF